MNVSFVQAMLGGAIITLSLTHGATAAPPAVHSVPLPGRNFPTQDELAKFLEPIPTPEIPDDPPPHEGAMISYPLRVAPPDLILVEVLEALPGRPISGERLVRPDGKVSLGFYGDIDVRGLTPEQIKVKMILHMRNFLPDDVLGLYKLVEAGPAGGKAVEDNEKPGAAAPPELPPAEPAVEVFPDTKPQASKKSPRASRAPARRARPISQGRGHEPLKAPADEKAQNPRTQPGANAESRRPETRTQPPEAPEMDPVPGYMAVAVHPAESDRVFVDITSYNHEIYYVYGDVAAPGRMPFTGQETVLDAITYAGGFIHTAETKDVQLVRPARRGHAAKTYPVDMKAIYAGDVKANYQVFPGDRLIVGRKETVKQTIKLDELTSAFSNMLKTLNQYNSMVVNARDLGGPKATAAITPEQRKAVMNVLVESWIRVMAESGGATFDEKALREALLKALATPPAESKPEGKD